VARHDTTAAAYADGVILEALDVPLDEFERATGWSVKPQGACRGEVCVPLPEGARLDGARVDVTTVAGALGMPLVADGGNGLWALGPETLSGRALTTAVAPELELPDLDGNPFRLSSLRGRKVLLVAWASW
jgi:hypothetical protein